MNNSPEASRNVVRLALFAACGVTDPTEQEKVMAIIRVQGVPDTPEGVIAQITDTHAQVKAAQEEPPC